MLASTCLYSLYAWFLFAFARCRHCVNPHYSEIYPDHTKNITDCFLTSYALPKVLNIFIHVNLNFYIFNFCTFKNYSNNPAARWTEEKTNRENITTLAEVSRLEIGKLAAHRKPCMPEVFDIKLEICTLKPAYYMAVMEKLMWLSSDAKYTTTCRCRPIIYDT